MNDRKDAEQGMRVSRFLASEEWQDAWATYEQALIAAMVDPKSSVADVEHQRKLLWAAKVAKQHLERLVQSGKVALETINLQEQQESALRRALRRWA